MPAAQFAQLAAPEAGDLPAEQLVHVLLPAAAENLPDKHDAQLTLPAWLLYVPAAQFEHTVSWVEAANVPAGQDVHVTVPMASAILPAAQA